MYHRMEMLDHLDSDEKTGGQDHWWRRWDWWEPGAAGTRFEQLEELDRWKEEVVGGTKGDMGWR